MPEHEIDAKDLFKKKTGEGSSVDPSPAIPSETEMREAASPELSLETFVIGDQTFQYRISSIRTQKLMALSLDAITDFLKKIDLSPILKNLQERLNRPKKKILEKIAEAKKNGDEKIDSDEIIQQMVDSDENNFMDMAEVVQDIIKHGGLSNIVGTVLSLYAGIVYAICYSQNKEVTREWIDDNLTMFDAQEIFFNQMQKDRIGGKVIDFLYLITRQVINQ